MSYGVVASKAASVQVELVVPEERRGYDRARERFRAPEATPWGSGRLTLTALHLSFVPNRPTGGVRPLTLALSDVVAVEATPGRMNKTISFRTTEMVLHARVTGAMAFAKQVAIAAEAARKRHANEAARPNPVRREG
ncbi:hypothetical protein BH09ACT12_BH09ACT12_33050 [soil metagenome]